MASETVLKELFEIAKGSVAFHGMSDKDIWGACLAYKDRSDQDIQVAMENIRKKDNEAVSKHEAQQKNLEAGKEKMIQLHKQEELDHQKDQQDAEKILEELFNS